MSLAEDYGFQARYLPHIKRLLGEVLFRVGDLQEDLREATDLIVLRLDGVRIGCRVRRNDYLEKYGSEFTVRSSRPMGTETELDKILRGWGEYLFYGFAAPSTTDRLIAARVIDLAIFRSWWNEYAGDPPGISHQTNGDGSSDFIAVEVAAIPVQAIVGEWGFPRTVAA